MSFTTNARAAAVKLLTKFGQTVTFTYSSSETYTIATQTNAKTPATFTGKAVSTNYIKTEIDGSSIQQGDIRLLVENTTVAPVTDNTVVIDTITYRVMDVESINPNGSNIMYICQLRI
jgi:hypothetical protein